MEPDLLEEIRASHGRLLAGTGAYHEQLRRELERPDLGPADRHRVLDALTCTTQLVEVLESVTSDRIHWLTRLRTPA